MDHTFDPFLKLSAIFGPGDHSRQIQRYDTPVCHTVRHHTGYDSLGQSFYNRCLTDSRLSDQTRIVFAASAQYLNHPFDLLLPADHRIQIVFDRHTCQISGVLIQHGCHTVFPADWLSVLKVFLIGIGIFSHGHKNIDIHLLHIDIHRIHQA